MWGRGPALYKQNYILMFNTVNHGEKLSASTFYLSDTMYMSYLYLYKHIYALYYIHRSIHKLRDAL